MTASLLQLYRLLAQLFLDAADADTLMAEAGINRSRIADASPAARWHAIVTEADKDGKVGELIDTALVRFPNHAELRRLRNELVTEGCAL